MFSRVTAQQIDRDGYRHYQRFSTRLKFVVARTSQARHGAPCQKLPRSFPVMMSTSESICKAQSGSMQEKPVLVALGKGNGGGGGGQ